MSDPTKTSVSQELNVPKPSVRRVSPRKWAVLAATGLATATAPAVLPLLSPAPAFAASGEAGEAGEAGEGGVVLSEGATGFLTQLGYFEGTYRIIANLYLSGARDLARAHQEESHHAFYEDIEPALAKHDAPGFAAEAEAFAAAVRGDASDEEVEAALETLLQGLNKAAAAAEAPTYERLSSLRDLVALAAAEYDGGVEAGKVELAIEYRDSWGFYEVARQRAAAMSASDEAVLAKAGKDVLEQLDGAEALYPSLTTDTASTDPSQLAVAAGWIEIIALRHK